VRPLYTCEIFIDKKIAFLLTKNYLFLQTIATILYIYLATVTKAITFGGFLGDITGGLQVVYGKPLSKRQGAAGF
jgi:hypothetical protein